MNRILRIWIIVTTVTAGHLSMIAQDNSRTSLDWNGIYSGILPCADCEGIKTDIDLHPEGTFSLARRYLGKDDSLYTVYGTFHWNEQGNIIILENTSGGTKPGHFLVGENQLIKLDDNNQRIKGDLANRYILRKTGMDLWITDKYWTLIELRGSEVKGENTPPKLPHLILWSDTNRVTGNAGCNSFTGSYEMNDQTGRIQFSKVASTQMICPEMELEDQFMEVIEVTDNYSIKGDTLSLNRARMAPLAKFVAVYFE